MKVTLLIAALLLAIHAVFVEYGPRPATVKTQSQWQDNRYTLEAYLEHGSTASVVLVGSSLARRLDIGRLGPCFQNLAVAGDSSLTGLRTIVDAGYRPRQVLVEINVAQRQINERLVGEATATLPRELPILRVENSPVNLGLGFLYQSRPPESSENQTAQVFRSALAAQRASYEQPIPAATLADNMRRFAELIATLEQRGTRVMFLELPVDASLVELAQAVQVRTAFRHTFEKYPTLGIEFLSGGRPVQTIDGVHLKTFEAAAVIERLRPHVMACNSKAS